METKKQGEEATYNRHLTRPHTHAHSPRALRWYIGVEGTRGGEDTTTPAESVLEYW